MSPKAKTNPQERKVEFNYYAPEANEVFVVGEFNQWNTESLPMKKTKNGIWKAKVALPPGRYEYKLLADGAWVHSLPNVEMIPNPFGTQNFVIAVL
jgi:1,4-alpha-glucan branching enzyme